MQKILEVIEQKIRPALNAHGGDIEFAEMTPDGVVKVRLSGACAACPGAQQTMSELVEASLKDACPEVRSVILLHGVNEDLIAQALKILRKS